jgi:elongation factor Tu
VKRDQIRRGQVLSLPGSATPHRRFGADAYVLTEQEGGRRKPIHDNYRPRFHFRTSDVPGVLTLESAMVLPGDSTEFVVELGKPVAMTKGLGFAIREGGLTVAAGTVAELLD